MSELIDTMVSLIETGNDPKKVWEDSIVYSPGSRLRINKNTTGKNVEGNKEISIPKDTVVTVCGIGAGDTGTDKVVTLPNGTKAVVSLADF